MYQCPIVLLLFTLKYFKNIIAIKIIIKKKKTKFVPSIYTMGKMRRINA